MDILLLTDYRKQFYSAQRSSTVGMNLSRLKEILFEFGANITVKNFCNLDINNSLKNKIVLFQSSEDRNLFYKSYIEDILLGVEMSGGFLVPSFNLFRAHHNKLFFEILRDLSNLKPLCDIKSKYYGTLEDLLSENINKWRFPKVIKSSSGCKSQGVYLARNSRELKKIARKLTRSFNAFDFIRFYLKKHLRKNYISESNHRRKIIIQDFIPGLQGDFKILIYGRKYFVLHREIRPNDFRASGSGRFSYPYEPPVVLLDAARRVFEYFDCPYISLDMALDGDNPVVLEAQFLMFGTYALENAPFYLEHVDGSWTKINGNVELEFVFCECLVEFLKGKMG